MGQALKKHPGGRPTKYNRSVLDATHNYITNYETYNDVVPTIAGLAQALELSRDTVIKWASDESKPEFSYMCSRIMTAQERLLVNGGLESKYNSNVVKLMLSKHGYSDSDRNQGVTVNVVINDKPVEIAGLTLEHDE